MKIQYKPGRTLDNVFVPCMVMGIGDIVAAFARRLGIRGWRGCKCDQRRKWLNNLW